jgi:hypothetical protein
MAFRFSRHHVAPPQLVISYRKTRFESIERADVPIAIPTRNRDPLVNVLGNFHLTVQAKICCHSSHPLPVDSLGRMLILIFKNLLETYAHSPGAA